MTAKHIELSPGLSGERLDKILASQMPSLSRSQWQRLIREGFVLLNGEPTQASRRLDGTETIQVEIPEPAESDLAAEHLPLDIRYEDDDLIVVNKAAGMVVHPSPGHSSGTMVNALLAHCPDLQGVGDTKRPGIVHRLDKDTSGLIIAAKNDFAMRHLQKQFKKRTIEKRYLALVDGRIQPASALIDAPIGRDPRRRKMMSVISADSPRAGSSRSREAQTRYLTIETFAAHSLVECAPLTGRTHQIRVHLAYIGFPIVGDKVYGRRRQSLNLDRHFLHASRLTFKRPGDETTLSISAELPEELQAVIESLTPA